jgi:hypothetical protein
MRQSHGLSRGLLGTFRLFMAERRLHYKMVTKPLRWHYGKGDYTRMQKKESLRVTLPTSSRDGST